MYLVIGNGPFPPRGPYWGEEKNKEQMLWVWCDKPARGQRLQCLTTQYAKLLLLSRILPV